MTRGSSHARWAPLGILAVGLLLTAVATVVFHRTVQERDEARFRNAVESTQDRIQSRLDTYIALLLATRSFVEVSSNVDALPCLDECQVEGPGVWGLELREFRKFVTRLDLQRWYPGIQGVGLSVRVFPRDKADVEQEMRRQGHTSFRVWPEHERSEYHSIVFLEPLDRRNQAAIGYDMFSEPVRNEAMARARDTAAPAASRKVTLVQEIDREKQAGFLIYVPLYRGEGPATKEERQAALLGFVYSPFRVADLFRGIFGTERHPRVAFEVYDGLEPRPAALMYRSEPPRDGEKRVARFQSTERLDVAGVPWTLAYESSPTFEAASTRRFVPAFALAGILASLALFFVTASQVRARSRAEESRAEARLAKAEAEAQRNNLQALFMQAPAAIAIVEGDELRYVLSNPMSEELSGRRQLVGKTVKEVLPELEAQGFTRLAEEVIRTGEPFIGREVPVVVKMPNGADEQQFLNLTYQALLGPTGKVEGVMAFGYEVTEQVIARQHAEALAEDLKQAIRVRDDFLSIAGHELRTPLAALKLQAQGLQRQAQKGAFGPPQSRLLERLEKADGHIERLERLVGELLDVSRITSGRMTLQREDVDLIVLLSDIVDRFSGELDRTGSRISVRASSHVAGRWDRVRLDQVLTNLVANAIKYGEGKPIEVTVDEDDGLAWLTVRDHGIGIAPEDRERIFGRFERAVSERHYGGLGLGLWITHQIVEAHGGHISLKSTPGEGSAFTVELPRHPPEEEE